VAELAVRFSAECLIDLILGACVDRRTVLPELLAPCVLGGAPGQHRSDSLSAVFRNIPARQRSLIEKAIPSVGISRYGKSL
jgi:hypothetical protein